MGEPPAWAGSASRLPIVLLSVEWGHESASAVDVAVTAEKTHTVGDLQVALVEAFGGPSLKPEVHSEFQLVRPASGEVLAATATLESVELLSGERLRIVDRRRDRLSAGFGPSGRGTRALDPSAGVELVVGSGPDVGTSYPLEAGPMMIGRDPICDLALRDPTVARVHVTITGGTGPDPYIGSVAPGDDRAAPVRLNGKTCEEPTPFEVGDVIAFGSTTLIPRRMSPQVHKRRGGFATLGFHRTPYYRVTLDSKVFQPLGELPPEPEPIKFAYLMLLSPLAMGGVMALLFSYRFLIFTLLSPLMMVAGWFEQRRKSRQQRGRGIERFHRRLARRQVEVSEALASERKARVDRAPDLAQLHQRAATTSPQLWERDRAFEDFLELRIGIGDLAPQVDVKPETSGDERLRDEAAEALGIADRLVDVPVTIDLKSSSPLGLVGRRIDTADLASSLLLQAATLHSPEDLVVVAAISDTAGSIADWLKWLPHTRSNSSPIAIGHLASSKHEADRLINALLGVMEDRLAGAKDRSIDHRWPWILVVLDSALEPDPAATSRLLGAGKGAGISVIWQTNEHHRVPHQVVAVASLSPVTSQQRSVVSFTDPDKVDQQVIVERAPAWLGSEIGHALAPVRDITAADASSALPRMTPLNHALGVDTATPAWICEQWTTPTGYTLRGAMGVTVDGPLVLDLVNDGPHGLIAGTSGAGKSELIMSLVAGLAAANPPTRANFLFVDYKGGASTTQFVDLPHTVGYVTNLDEVLARRALKSLKAELNRRMDLLQGKAKDLEEMLALHPQDAPPSLVIVVDEFATLVKEIPEFVTGIVDIAQRGRSLGIHLILATQRPSGAVNENILANTNLRISLRMLDASESSSVIGSNEAAMIPTPLRGRGYLRLGPGRLTAFQTAWSGAPTGEAEGRPPVTVGWFGAGNGGVGPATSHRAGSSEPPGVGTATDESQLDQLLGAILQASNQLGSEAGRSPWMDELPVHLPLENLLEHPRTPSSGRQDSQTNNPHPSQFSAVIGLIDEPEAQDQYEARVDLAGGGGLIVVGTGGSGKTNTLAALALSAAHEQQQIGSSHFTVLGLDFASRKLVSLNALPYCAEVATGDDHEAVTRIIAVLSREFQRRRSEMAVAARTGAQADFSQSRVLLLIDDYGNLADSFEGSGSGGSQYQWLETLNQVIVDGRQVGITTALTATRRAVIKTAIQASIENRIVLRQADKGAYMDNGVPSSLVSESPLVVGRGYFNSTLEMQVAVASDPGRSQTDITADPSLVSQPLLDDMAPIESERSQTLVPLGVCDITAQPHHLDLTFNSVAVIGPPRSGRTNALWTVGRHLIDSGRPVWAVGPPDSPLVNLEGLEASGFGGAQQISEVLMRLADHVDALNSSDNPASAVQPLVLIDDVDLIDEPGIEAACIRISNAGVRFVATSAPIRGFSTNQLVQDLKRVRSFVVLNPVDGREVQEIAGTLVTIRPGLAQVPGRCVAVANRVGVVVQISHHIASAGAS